MSHDHVHTDAELAMLNHIQALSRSAELFQITEHLCKKALLTLLPEEGQSVTVALDPTKPFESITMEDGTPAKYVTLFRSGDTIDVAADVD